MNVDNSGNWEERPGNSEKNFQLLFAKSQNHAFNAVASERYAADDITVIYLSFTNVRISIALPGGGVSLAGGSSVRPLRRRRQ
jgi:hypothetical protein